MTYQITQTSSLNGNNKHNEKWLDDSNSTDDYLMASLKLVRPYNFGSV